MRHKEEKILMGEDRLLRREKSWRRARVGAIALFFIFIVAAIPIYGGDTMSKEEKSKAFNLIVIGCVFLLLIIEYMNLRFQHIDSINLYREKLKGQVPILRNKLTGENGTGSDADNGKVKD
jgi:hypothetical protein